MSIVDNAFVPETVFVSVGDSVLWTNNGINPHSSTSGLNGVPDGLWNSGVLAHGATFSRGFPNNGTFNYYCQFHYLLGMQGVVVVGSGSVGEAATSSVLSGIEALPNPFIGSISLRLLPPGTSTLRVFSATGTLVRTLPVYGRATVYWDGRDSHGREVRPGVFFCSFGSRTVAITRLP